MPDNDVQPADLQLAEVRPAYADAARPMTQRELDLLARLTLAKTTFCTSIPARSSDSGSPSSTPVPRRCTASRGSGRRRRSPSPSAAHLGADHDADVLAATWDPGLLTRRIDDRGPDVEAHDRVRRVLRSMVGRASASLSVNESTPARTMAAWLAT